MARYSAVFVFQWKNVVESCRNAYRWEKIKFASERTDRELLGRPVARYSAPTPIAKPFPETGLASSTKPVSICVKPVSPGLTKPVSIRFKPVWPGFRKPVSVKPVSRKPVSAGDL